MAQIKQMTNSALLGSKLLSSLDDRDGTSSRAAPSVKGNFSKEMIVAVRCRKSSLRERLTLHPGDDHNLYIMYTSLFFY